MRAALLLVPLLAACAPLTPEEQAERQERMDKREYARLDARNVMYETCRGRPVVLTCSERRGAHQCTAVDYRHAMARCR